ncbi:NUDIX domain-containing protein [Staphylococcus epidermidis]|nr:NUDIX domain-containing protein [Staphylococcus epidermidis]
MQEKRMTARPPLDAAVLVPIVLREHDSAADRAFLPSSLATPARWHFRAANEILPDVSAEATALREAHEEVGLAPQNVEVLGRFRFM